MRGFGSVEIVVAWVWIGGDQRSCCDVCCVCGLSAAPMVAPMVIFLKMGLLGYVGFRLGLN